jgi:glycosyltransferase involved in cell wall biosynthesis
MAGERLRVALIEPYLGGSHRAWAEGFARNSRHDVSVFGLPAIHWKWRMQGGHVSLLPSIEASVSERGPFDVVLATSMTNLAGLLGLGRRALHGARVALYLHENQLTFPLSPDDEPDFTYAMINWTSMLAADVVIFNSQFHLDAWFDELPGFLRRFPDRRHTTEIADVRTRSIVLPVGADVAALVTAPRTRGDRPLVLWNQRWEYDKGPAEFGSAIAALLDDGLDVDVALAGDRPGGDPPARMELVARLGDRLVHDGEADAATYRSLLLRSDIVVSTARHEFFGVAITEAVAAGAFPVLPNRLVYPERIPVEHHRDCLYDEGGVVDRLRWAITHPVEARAVADALRPTMSECDWATQAPLLDDALAG